MFIWIILILIGLALAINVEESFDGRTHSRVAIATMVTTQPDFQHWITYHLGLVDRIYLKIENAQEIVELASRYPEKIYYEVTDDGNQTKLNNYFTQMDRQKEFVDRMIKKAKSEGIDYMFHIDADELISSSSDLRSHLTSVPQDTACIHFKNFEAVFKNNTHCFQAVKFMDCQREACTSYANGKSCAVIKNDPTFNGPHYFSGKVYEMDDNKIKILHFDSCTYDAWKQKFSRMTKTKPGDIPLTFYKNSIELMSKNPTDDEMLKFYKDAKWEHFISLY
jgi:hypothetical protein